MNSRNIARCALCNDIIESTYRHHFITCSCGAISLDGGDDYVRGVGSPENFLQLSEEEIAAWDSVPTGRLEDWAYVGGVIYGAVFDDKLKRFRDGTEIHTSPVASPAKDRKEGKVIQTRGSTYLLGKKFEPRKDWTAEVVEVAAEVGVGAF